MAEGGDIVSVGEWASADLQAPGRRTEKISDVVAREIVQDIVQRRLAPGTMLPSESAMLDQFRVARASLREALRILEVHGLVVIKPGPGGGPMVAGADSRHFARMAALYFQMSRATFKDLLEARRVLEPLMARLAAQRGSPAAKKQLKRVTEVSESSNVGDARYVDNSSEFHVMILGMSGNPVLDLIGVAMKTLYTDRVRATEFSPKARERVLEEHDAMADAIMRGNGTLAEQLMEQHMGEFTEYSIRRNPGMADELITWT